MKLRRSLDWKSWYYEVILPALRRLGPEGCDLALSRLGRAYARTSPGRRGEIGRAVARTRAVLGARWDEAEVARAVEANLARFSARDYPLDGLADDEVASRFEVEGAEHLDSAAAKGRGVIVVGSHLGAYLPAQHWLYRRGIPLRLLVQRPDTSRASYTGGSTWAGRSPSRAFSFAGR